MLDVSFNYGGIEITNILHEDLSAIVKRSETDRHFSIARLDERFLESFLSECEYFLKVSRGGSLLGLVKGRVEFKKPHEAWIWFYYMDGMEDNGVLARSVAEKLLEYLSEEYCVRDFYIRVPVEEHKAIEFWRGMGFKPQREVKDFYFIDGQNVDMLILENRNMKFSAKKNIL